MSFFTTLLVAAILTFQEHYAAAGTSSSQKQAALDDSAIPSSSRPHPPPAFVINLAYRPERLATFDEEARSVPLEYTVIRASDQDDAREALKTGQVRLNETYVNPFGNRAGMKLGEIGCALSHVEAWRKASELDPDAFAIIFEDDAQLAYDFSDRIIDIVQSALVLEADFVYLSYLDRFGAFPKPVDTQLQTCAYYWWATAYMISGAAARALYASAEQYLENLIPVDDFLPIILGTLDAEESRRSVTKNQVQAMSCADNLDCTDTGLDPRYPNLRLKCLSVRGDLLARQRYDGVSASDTEVSDVVGVAVAPDHKPKLLVLTVATDLTHYGFETLRRSADFFGYQMQVLGAGMAWTGGDIYINGGGLMKLILVREALAAMDGDQIVLFVDGNDVIFQLGPDAVLRQFQTLTEANNADVVFAAEKGCWPNLDTCKRYVKWDEGPNRFLNSGTYIGQARHLRSLLVSVDPDRPADDDQEYFSLKLANYRETGDGVRMMLDSTQTLFQPMQYTRHDEWACNPPGYLFQRGGIVPAVLHGNGDSKRTLIGLGNYVAGAFHPASSYGTMRYRHVPTKNIYPLAIGLYFTGTQFEFDFIAGLALLDIDRTQTHLFVYCAPDTMICINSDTAEQYASYNILDGNMDESLARANFLSEAVAAGVHYALMLDSDVIIQRPSLVADLAGWNRTIVAGHAQRLHNGELSANYWTDMDTKNGLYKEGFDTFPVYTREHRGLFAVPYASGIILIHGTELKRLAGLFRSHLGSGSDSVRRVCAKLADSGLGVYVDNRHIYATLLDKDGYDRPGGQVQGPKGTHKKSLFEALDVNGDNKLTKEEAEAFFTMKGAAIPDDLMANEDIDSDGFISWEEFQGPKGDTPPATSPGRQQQEIQVPEEKGLFEELDANGDNKLSKEEAEAFFTSRGTAAPDDLMANEDKDGDGFISWEEFQGPKGNAPPSVGTKVADADTKNAVLQSIADIKNIMLQANLLPKEEAEEKESSAPSGKSKIVGADTKSTVLESTVDIKNIMHQLRA